MKFPRIPYWQFLTVPALMFAAGFILNAFVMSQNSGSMPVLVPGGCDASIFVKDLIHGCMSSESHWRFLADWIVIRDVGVASPGDFLEWAFDYTVWPSAAIWFTLMVTKEKL